MKKSVVVFLVVGMMFLMTFVSAGFFNETWSLITGRVGTTNPVTQTITVTGGSAPVIYDVWNETMTDLSSSGPTEDSPTYVIINFSASDSEGAGNLDDSTAFIDLESGGTSRTASCTKYESSGNYANYTCNVTIWWFDPASTAWTINASISDTSTNYAQNITDIFAVGSLAGFSSSPSSLTWSSISPGAIDAEPTNNILMNNTGNMVRNVELNATDLIGETNSAQALWAANFSAHTASGCSSGTTMVADTYTDVAGASLPVGNYTGGSAGQEEIYICLEAANAILDAQDYSTTARGAWTVKIVA